MRAAHGGQKMSKTTDVWMPVYIGDLLSDTLHLTPAEFGAYHYILYHQWKNGPIPDRQLRAITRLSREQWEESQATLKDFLRQDENGLWFQKRCASEKEKSNRLSEISRINGLKGGRPKTQNKPKQNPAGIPAGYPEDNPDHKLNETPSQSQSYKPSTRTKTISPADAERVYQAYPRKEGKAKAVAEIKKALGLFTATELLERIERQKSHWKREERETQFIPHASTWFHQKRYEDESNAPVPDIRLTLPDGTVTTKSQTESEGWITFGGLD